MAVDEREFIDILYNGWTKTTEAEISYWQPLEDNDFPGLFNIVAVTIDPETREESVKPVASFLSEEDAGFITAIHGSFADVCRRVLQAYDEADLKDEQRDEAVVRIAELEIEVDEYRQRGAAFPLRVDITETRDGAGVE